jgi:hypothetical protein
MGSARDDIEDEDEDNGRTRTSPSGHIALADISFFGLARYSSIRHDKGM